MDKWIREYTAMVLCKRFYSINILLIGVIFVISQANVVEARTVHRIMDFNKPVHEMVQRCRANCLNMFLHDETNQITTDECSSRPNCFMCWDFCRLLHNEKKIIVTMMCSNTTCLSGCKQACKFYKLPFFDKKPKRLAAPIVDNNQSVPDISKLKSV